MSEEQVVNEIKEESQAQGDSPSNKAKSRFNLGSLFSKLGALKIPILVVLVSVLAISTALIITKVTHSNAATKSEKKVEKDKKRELGKFIPLDTFTVNLKGGQNYLQTGITFEIEGENPDLEKELKERKPQISDIVITMLSSKSIDEISSTVEREKLKAEIKKAVDSQLGYGKIEHVYFTTFIMQ